MDRARRDELIARYREGPAVVEHVVAGLGDEALDHVPADGGWSAREVIHHLADSEMLSAARLRLLLVEDAPVIQGYDERSSFAVCTTTRGRSDARWRPYGPPGRARRRSSTG